MVEHRWHLEKNYSPNCKIIFNMLPVVVFFSFYSLLLAKCSLIMDSVYEVEDTQIIPLDNDSGFWNMVGPLIQTGSLSSWVYKTKI